MKELTAETRIKLSQIKEFKTCKTTNDKHSAYKPGDIAKWSDGYHMKRSDGTWEKLQKKENTSKEKGFAKTLREEFQRNTLKYLNSEFKNKGSGISVIFTKDSVDELMSKVLPSKKQGFTLRDHFEMINQIKYLFETAYFVKEHDDTKNKDKDVTMKRFLSRPVKLSSGRRARALITVKCTISKGHQAVYSLEGFKIKRALEQARAKGQDHKGDLSDK